MKYITNIYFIILFPGKQVLFSCFMGFIGIIITVHSVASNTFRGTMAVNRNELFRLFYQPSGIFFYQSAGYHDLVSASLTLQPEIRTHSQDFPLSGTTGVLFFQCNNIAYLIFHVLLHSRLGLICFAYITVFHLTCIPESTAPILSVMIRSAIESRVVSVLLIRTSLFPL